MSELALLLPKLQEQLEEAIKNKSFDEVAELKEMIFHIEKPVIERHLRVVGTEAWREFNTGGRK